MADHDYLGTTPCLSIGWEPGPAPYADLATIRVALSARVFCGSTHHAMVEEDVRPFLDKLVDPLTEPAVFLVGKEFDSPLVSVRIEDATPSRALSRVLTVDVELAYSGDPHFRVSGRFGSTYEELTHFRGGFLDALSGGGEARLTGTILLAGDL